MGMIGENLKHIRKLNKLSQAKVAELAGVSQQLISQLETGTAEKTPNSQPSHKLSGSASTKLTLPTRPMQPGYLRLMFHIWLG